MAITIDTTPNETLNSVFQPILFVVSSNKSNPELKIKCKIENYDGSSWKTLGIQSIDKDAAGNFNCYVHQVLNAAIVINLPQGTHGQVIDDAESVVKFRVRFTELIYDADDLYVESGTILSSEYWCTNIIFQALETGSPEEFVIVAGDGSVLSSQPITRKVKSNQPLVISYIFDEASNSPVPELTVSP